ncbi:MAG: hypothetical protein JXR54_09975 [Tannerellaceae bacterium]|nr:hypothetical protein [Tannerellaceae bacterium]
MPRLEQILPLSGLIVDSIDDEAVGSDKGIVLSRINMRPDLTGRKGANVPIGGTTYIDTPLPEGTNKTLGWCNDNQNEAIIWCVWNSNGNHSILRYYTLTKTVEKIFYSEPTLGFAENTEIAAEVVDGRFYWNDNNDQPKGFNIQKAVNYTNGYDGKAYSSEDAPFDENVFPFYKKPPRYAPTYIYESLTEFKGQTIDFNNLRKKQWQVKYCFVYEDFQESPYSPISKLVTSENEVSVVGQWTEELTFNNALKISVNTGSHNVKQIKVAIRDASNLNSAPFYVFETIDKFKDDIEQIASDTYYDVYFLNNGYLENIDTDRENAYYYNVPLSAKDMLLIDGKYLGMSMPKTGYDFKNEQLNYSLDYVKNKTDFSVSGISMVSDYDRDGTDPWRECGLRAFGRTRIRITIPAQFYRDSIYRVTFKTPDIPSGSPFVKQPEVTATWASPSTRPADYPKVAQEALIAQLHDQIDKCYSLPIKVRKSGDTQVRFDFYYGGLWLNVDRRDPVFEWKDLWKPLLDNYKENIYGDIIYGESTPTYRGLKRGQYHSFGIVYNDEFGRYNAVFGEKTLYIPPADISLDADDQENYYTPKITINSTPPDWAYTYRLAYIPYASYTYTQEVPGVEIVEGDSANGIEAGYKFLKINQAILSIIGDFPDSTISAYSWQKGDRLRQVGYPESYEILKEFTRTYTVSDQSTTETGYLVKGDFVLVGDKIDLVEIYRPNRTPQDKIYYEIGEEYPVLNPGTENRVHSGGVQTQTSTLPAILQPNFGDIYLRARFSSEATEGYAIVEDNHYSDYYPSNGISIGRGLVRIDLKQETVRRVIKTENYIENTEFNRLNVIIPGDETFTVSEVYGDITKVVERGDTIKIIQPHRETSVYIGKNYAKDAAGGDIALNTDNVFGSPQFYEAFAGSGYRKSIILAGTSIYYMDVMTADFYRSAMNGTMSISKRYGLNKYFEEICEQFRSYSGNKDVIVGYESSEDVLYVSFIMGDTISTTAFSEDDNSKGFVFQVEFNNGPKKPEEYANYGDYLYSFVDGHLYEHGTGLPNQFYGSERKAALIKVVANQYPQLRKTFEYMSVDTNGDWSAEFEIEPDDNYPSGQKTKILPKMFKSREGVKTSAVPRNILNQSGVENMQKLYSGNKISGNSVKISFTSLNFDIMRGAKVVTINQK